MGTKKTVGIVLIVVGIVVLILSAIADAIGIGGNPGFGPIQLIGIIVGIAAAVVGLVLILRK